MIFIFLAIATYAMLGCMQLGLSIDVKEVRADIVYLASDSLEGRETGTEGERMAAEYIAARMAALGLYPAGESGTFFQTFATYVPVNPHTPDGEKETLTGRNVVGSIDHKADNTVVIGAHYDHLGFGGMGSLHAGEDAIHNGADDNASGIAAMLQLAELLQKRHTDNNYLFIAFSGEEKGLLGSNYFTKNATIDLTTVNYMLNMDMVGRLKPEKTLAINGVGTSPLWTPTLEQIDVSDIKFVTTESGFGPSDHTSFYK
ncbi:MAG: M28 family peptidase, partial [Saprospiraceae bacterium]|nr:M28 family peptidase [Saprospiraceae bacterium]